MNDRDLIQAFEEGKLYVRCLNTVQDDEGIYCYTGSKYEVVDISDDLGFMNIASDYLGIELQISRYDEDFDLFIDN